MKICRVKARPENPEVYGGEVLELKDGEPEQGIFYLVTYSTVKGSVVFRLHNLENGNIWSDTSLYGNGRYTFKKTNVCLEVEDSQCTQITQ